MQSSLQRRAQYITAMAPVLQNCLSTAFRCTAFYILIDTTLYSFGSGIEQKAMSIVPN